MNVQDAVAKLNSVGGNAGNLSASDFYEVYRALQGSFIHADELGRMEAYVSSNRAKFDDADLQDKILKDVTIKEDNLEEFKNNYQAVSVFSNVRPVKNKFAKQAYEFIDNYSKIGTFDADDLDSLETISKNLKKDVDENVYIAKPSEKKALSSFIKRVEKEAENFVVSEGLENVEAIPAAEINANLSAVDSIEEELNNSPTGIYAQENDKIFNLLKTIEVAPAQLGENDDHMDTRQFQIESYDMIAEEAKRRCATNPAFNALKPHEKKLAYLKAKEEATDNYIRETLVAQAVFSVIKSYGEGTSSVSPKQRKEFVTAANKALSDLKKGGENAKITINKDLALNRLLASETRNKAAAKYIARKTKFGAFVERAKKRVQEFEEKHPKTYETAKTIGKACLKGAIKGGTVMAASALMGSGAGLAASAAFAVHSSIVSMKALHKQYKQDPNYQGKGFGKYLWNHKADAAVGIAAAASAAIASGFAVTAFLPVGSAIEASTRRIVRGTAGAASGVSSGIKKLVSAENSKDRKIGWAMIGGAAAVGAVSMFFADDIAKIVREKFGIGTALQNKEAPSSKVVQNVVDNNKPSITAEPSKYKWSQDFDKWNMPEESSQGVVDEYKGPYRPGFEPSDENLTEKVDYSKSFARDFDQSLFEKGKTTAYNSGIQLAEGGKAEFDGMVERLHMLNPDLVAAAASRGISPEQIANLSQLEELQFHGKTYIRSYSITLTRDAASPEFVSGGHEYVVSKSTLMNIIKGNCDDLTVEEQLKVIDNALSHHDVNNGNEFIGVPKHKGDEWEAMQRRATVKMGEGCDEENKIRSKVYGYVRETTESKETLTVSEEKETSTTTVNNNTFIFNYNEEISEVVEQQQPVQETVVQEPVIIKEEVPAAKAPIVQEPEVKAPAEFNEIIGSKENFAQVATEKGWIFKDGKFEHVGTEKAFAYMNEIAEKQRDFAVKALRGGWGLELNDASFASDEKLAAAYKADLEKGHVFVVNENGQLKTYMVKGGVFHTALYESNPEKYGDSYNKAQQEIADFRARQAAAAAQSSEAATTTTTTVDTEQTSVKKQSVIINAGKGYGD